MFFLLRFPSVGSSFRCDARPSPNSAEFRMPRGPMRELFTFTVAIGLTSCGQSAGNGQADATRQESNAVAVAVSARSDGPEVAPVERPEGPVVFTSALGLPQRGSSVEPQLRHASVATPADWPASFFTTFKTARGEASSMIAACRWLPPMPARARFGIATM